MQTEKTNKQANTNLIKIDWRKVLWLPNLKKDQQCFENIDSSGT